MASRAFMGWILIIYRLLAIAESWYNYPRLFCQSEGYIFAHDESTVTPCLRGSDYL